MFERRGQNLSTHYRPGCLSMSRRYATAGLQAGSQLRKLCVMVSTATGDYNYSASGVGQRVLRVMHPGVEGTDLQSSLLSVICVPQ